MAFDPETGMGDSGDEELDAGDMEAELGNQPKKKHTKPKQKLMALSDIDKLVANCMENVGDVSDEDFEDDADLLAELEGLTPMESNASVDNTLALPPSTSYNTYDKFGLGMDFDPETGMGDSGDEELDAGDIEAELAALQGNRPKKKPTKPKQKLMALSDIDKLAANCCSWKMLAMLTLEDDADLLAELEGLTPMESNSSVNNTLALPPTQVSTSYNTYDKKFDVHIQNIEQGNEVDLSQRAPPPPGFPGGLVSKLQQPTPSPRRQTELNVQLEPPPPASVSADSAPGSVGPPASPKTGLEAREQRLEKYQSGVEDAKKEGSSGKARGMDRIVKTPHQPSTAPAKKPPAPNSPSTRVPPQAAIAAEAKSTVARGRNEKELAFLLRRQKEFKLAALSAKTKGDMETARKYLREAKGFDSTIEAAKNGRRIDLTKVPDSPSAARAFERPVTPSTDHDYVMIREEDCTPDASNREKVFGGLEITLKSQYEMCKKNAQHYSKLADLENSKRFQKLARNSKRDYESVQHAFDHGYPPPRYHYENRSFTIIRSNTDLGDQDCQLTIVKCINIPLASGYGKDDMKVYVTFEFPFPNEQPQTGCTETIKYSINPEFNQSFKLSIDRRRRRALARSFRRHGVKFEIKLARGFFRDKTLGQATVKLAPFENKSEIHECVDLFDPEKGRKAIGGEIEIKLRVREPLTDKDVEIQNEKWLVIEASVAPSNRARK